MMRRSFLSMLGLGPLAATLGAQGQSLQGGIPYTTSGQALGLVTDAPTPISIKEHVQFLRDELSGLDDKEAFIANYMLTEKSDIDYVKLDQIDPDIQSMKSFSGVTKMRLYYRRRAEKRWEQRRHSLMRHIADVLGTNKGNKTNG